MERLEPKAHSIPTAREGEVEYLLDMIAELAKLAHRIGEPQAGILLEAILTVRKAAVGKNGAQGAHGVIP